jgi:hypothetical protein
VAEPPPVTDPPPGELVFAPEVVQTDPPPRTPPAAPRRAPGVDRSLHDELTLEEAVQRQAIGMMDHLAGVRDAMEMLAAAKGQGPGAGPSPDRPKSGVAGELLAVAASGDAAPPNTHAPSGAAGSAPSGGGGGSGALYALLITLAALAGGLSAKLEILPIRWRSVTIVALNERPG